MARPVVNVEEDFALVLAGTVQPNLRMGPMARKDPKQREADYVTGLTYYLTEHPRIRKFIFIENSGWNLSGIREAVEPVRRGAEIEFISLDCNEHPEGRPFSVSYGESALMKLGLAQSKLFRQVQYFGKITGRLRLLNMMTIIDRASRPFDMYCDLQSHHVPIQFVNTSKSWLAFKWGWKHYHQCDTRFFVCTPAFYDRHLRDLHERHEGAGAYWIEGAWFETLMPMRHDPRVITRFPVQPHYSGVNGTIGFSYDSPKESAKRIIRGINRKVFPWWWL